MWKMLSAQLHLSLLPFDYGERLSGQLISQVEVPHTPAVPKSSLLLCY